MAIFGGPPKDITFQMAQGVASSLIQILRLGDMDGETRSELLKGMEVQGLPSTKEALVTAAASLVSEQNMGWIRKNQYLGFIYGSLVYMGMSEYEAKYWKKMIQIEAGF